ncbi:MAG TPA: TatD family hydrolase [Candidatus Nanoarchaeia archaeon]|nr:TatD family hydrolase [Candidatus Nanoarchaeia archaeon]
MTFIDIHAHLEFFDNLDKIIKKAKKRNVKIILANGIDVETNKKVLAFAKEYPEVQACLGIYPANALKLIKKEIDSEIKIINENKDKIIAIGEVGLDLKEAGVETLVKQKEILKKFVKLAKDLDKPIFIHSRKAEKETVDLLETLNYNKIIMHCFNGKLNLVEKGIHRGWFFSIPTTVKFNEQFQEMIKIIPIEQLFCETDSPFLHPDKKFPNEPANVIESYNKIAEIKGIPLADVEKKIEENYRKLFLVKTTQQSLDKYL